MTATTIAFARARPRGGAATRVLRSAARGGILIGVAVIIGVALLQVVDEGLPGGAGGVTPPTAVGVTTTTAAGGRSPQEVSVFVQNGSGVANAAATKANELRGLGYAQAGTGNAPLQTGITVACKAGFEEEAKQLATQLSAGGVTATVVDFPAAPPADAATASCLVTIGK